MPEVQHARPSVVERIERNVKNLHQVVFKYAVEKLARCRTESEPASNEAVCVRVSRELELVSWRKRRRVVEAVGLEHGPENER